MCIYACVYMLSRFSRVQIYATLWIVACPQWDSPGKNTGVGCHALLQGIFQTQGLNLFLIYTCKCFFNDIIFYSDPLSMSNEFLQIFDVINKFVANIPAYTSLQISFTVSENTFLRVDFLSQIESSL